MAGITCDGGPSGVWAGKASSNRRYDDHCDKASEPRKMHLLVVLRMLDGIECLYIYIYIYVTEVLYYIWAIAIHVASHAFSSTHIPRSNSRSKILYLKFMTFFVPSHRTYMRALCTPMAWAPNVPAIIYATKLLGCRGTAGRFWSNTLRASSSDALASIHLHFSRMCRRFGKSECA